MTEHTPGSVNSMRTRVAPIFVALSGCDPTGASWLRTLLDLPERGGSFPGRDLPLGGALVEPTAFGEDERGLLPPRELLRWLVRNPDCWKTEPDAAEDSRRRALWEGDPATLGEALTRIDESPKPGRGTWWILEGRTWPDVYLETADLIVVIEGKRTEWPPTTSTTWMPVRHQLLRHIDAAFEANARGKRLAGFFLVEGEASAPDGVPDRWKKAVEECVSDAAIEGSLPHRTGSEREAIREAVLGAATWQALWSAVAPFPPTQ